MAATKRDFVVRTTQQVDLVDISREIENCIYQSSVKNGVATVFSPHTTACIVINENEPRLIEDIKASVKEIISWNKPYGHNQIDHNAPSHIVSTLIGPSTSLLIEDGKMVTGTWQSVFLLELDGPRTRKIKVMIVGD